VDELGEVELLGLTLGDSLLDGEADDEGLIDALSLVDGLTLGLGDNEGEPSTNVPPPKSSQRVKGSDSVTIPIFPAAE